MSYSSEVLIDSPAGYWRMSEGSGQPQDSSGNGNHTDFTSGTPEYSQVGALLSDSGNTGIKLVSAGTEEWFRGPYSASLDVGDVFTIEAWVKRSLTGILEQTIYNKFVGSGSLYVRNDGIMLASDSIAIIVQSTVTITDTTTWHHVACTKNGATSKLYIDGEDVTGTVTDATCTSPVSTFWIGSEHAANSPFDGSLDEVAVYPTALSAARILVHYNAAFVRARVPISIVSGRGRW